VLICLCLICLTKELEIQKQKYNELALKYQSVLNEQENNSRAKLNDAEINKNKLANELRLLHDEKLANEQKLKQDLENLRAITKDLHQRLGIFSLDYLIFCLFEIVF
jgi:hypothetical protein